MVGHLGVSPALLLDPFARGEPIVAEVPAALVRPWTATEIAMRMLNNLTAAYQRRGTCAALSGAGLRLALPADEPLRNSLQAQLRALRAQLN